MSSLTYQISGGGVVVDVTITEVDGALRFDLQVLEETGTIGDLNALYLDIADESLLAGMAATGDDVTGTVFDADSVKKIDNFTSINGEVLKDLGAFDIGVQIGTQGMAKDDIQSTSFMLSHPDQALTLELFALQDCALRLTSVGEVDGSRDGSLKLGGEVGDLPEEPPVEEPPVEEPPVEEPPVEEPPVEEPPVEEPPVEEPPVVEPPVEEPPVVEPPIDEPPAEEPTPNEGGGGTEVPPGDSDIDFVFDDPIGDGPVEGGDPLLVVDPGFDEPLLGGEPVPTFDPSMPGDFPDDGGFFL